MLCLVFALWAGVISTLGSGLHSPSFEECKVGGFASAECSARFASCPFSSEAITSTSPCQISECFNSAWEGEELCVTGIMDYCSIAKSDLACEAFGVSSKGPMRKLLAKMTALVID